MLKAMAGIKACSTAVKQVVEQVRYSREEKMNKIVGDQALDIVFRKGRSYNRFLDKPVSDVLIEAVYDLARMGPTSANCCPARFVFAKTLAAREKLAQHAIQNNKAKILSAPVVVIIGQDMEFYERIPELFPHNPGAREWFAGDDAGIRETAFRNSTLQGAYLMLAARSLGLDCGPMSGFDADAVNASFFAGTTIKVNFICALGYGSDELLFPRGPRLAFDDACSIL